MHGSKSTLISKGISLLKKIGAKKLAAAAVSAAVPAVSVSLAGSLAVSTILTPVISFSTLFLEDVEEIEPTCTCAWVTRTEGTDIVETDGVGTTGANGSKGTPLKTVEIPEGLGSVFTVERWDRNVGEVEKPWSKASNQYKLIQEAGQNYDEYGLGIINGRYVIACTTTFGNVGDYIDFYQSNGNVLKCIMGDAKNQSDDGCNKWGHLEGDCIVEFCVLSSTNSAYNKSASFGNPGSSNFHPEWDNLTITKAVNFGSYFDGVNPDAPASDSASTSAAASSTTGSTESLVGAKELGTFTTTAYCPCSKCCGPYANGITASGKTAKSKHTIAVDPNVIPLGSKVMINNQIYYAEDTGGAIKDTKIDIYFDTHQEALDYGKKDVTVYLLTDAVNTTTTTSSDKAINLKAAEWAINTANNPKAGYDRTNRNGPDYDCSSFVSHAYVDSGATCGVQNTSSMYEGFTSTCFTDVTSSWDGSTSAGLVAGDVLLKSGHAAIYVGNNQKAEAHWNENKEDTGGQTGDQNGHEIDVTTFSDEGWTYILRHNDAVNGTVSTAVSAGPVELVDQPGVPSGLWPSLLDDVKKHPSSQSWTKLAADVGKAPMKKDYPTRDVDKFKQFYTNGVAQYMQGTGIEGRAVHTFQSYIYNLGSTFTDAGCGVCATATVMTTLSGKVVNPAEVALAGMTYGDRNPGKSYKDIFSGGGSDVFLNSGVLALFKEAGFTCEGGKLEQSKVDEYLSKNGMVIFVGASPPVNTSPPGGVGHFVAFREKVDNLYYIADSGNINVSGNLNNTGYEWNTLAKTLKAYSPEAIYVAPMVSMGQGTLASGTNGDGSQTNGKKIILYHTGNENCERHNGYYCSCGLKSALDIRKEYILSEQLLPTVLSEDGTGEDIIDPVKTISNISLIKQSDTDYAKGTEITSLAMLLKHLGYSVTVDSLITNYLTIGEVGKTDPNTAFVGDPKEEDSYGCYAPVIASTANKYFEAVEDAIESAADIAAMANPETSVDMQGIDNNYTAKDITGTEFQSLLTDYVAKDNPVILWVTEDMQEVKDGDSWVIDGKTITWKEPENCVLLMGYDMPKGTVKVADPLKGNIAEYESTLVQQRYEAMGKMAVVIPKPNIGSAEFSSFHAPYIDEDAPKCTITSSYKSGYHISIGQTYHKALDFGTGGTAAGIASMWDGEVVSTGTQSGYGQTCVVKHNIDGHTVYTKYNHMVMGSPSQYVKVGDKVRAGDRIGTQGGSGGNYAVHLDLQMAVFDSDYNYTEFKKHLVNPAAVILGWSSSIDDLTMYDNNTCIKKGTDFDKTDAVDSCNGIRPWAS